MRILKTYDGIESKNYSINSEAISNVNDIILDIFEEHEELKMFLNNISVSSRTESLMCKWYEKIAMTSSPLDNYKDSVYTINEIYNYSSGTSDCIMFMNLDINKLINIQGTRGNFPYEMVELYCGKYLYNDVSLREKCVNVLQDIKFKSGMMNFIDIKDFYSVMYHEGFTTGKYGKFNCRVINEFLLAGDDSTVVAIILSEGKMIVKWDVIKYIMSKNVDKAKKLLISIFKRYYEFFKIYSEFNITYIEEKIKNKNITKAYNTNIDGFIDDYNSSDIVGIYNAIERYQTSNLFKDSFYGMTCQKYKNLIRKMFNDISDQVNILAKDAYNKGMQFNNKMLETGWVIAENSEVPYSTDTDIWWKIEFSDGGLIPDRFCWENQYYRIPENKRKWKIYNLYMSGTNSAKIRCNEDHPNINHSGNVCIGDLIPLKLETSTVEDLIKYKTDLCNLLICINYDSPYDSRDKEELLKVSTLMDIGVVNSENIPVTTTLRQIKKTNFNHNRNLYRDDTGVNRDIESHTVDLISDGQLVFNNETVVQDEMALSNAGQVLLDIISYPSTQKFDYPYNLMSYKNSLVWHMPKTSNRLIFCRSKFLFMMNTWAFPKIIPANSFNSALPLFNLINEDLECIECDFDWNMLFDNLDIENIKKYDILNTKHQQLI